MNRLTSPWTMPAWMARAHGWLYARSGGRFGHGVIGAPVLLLPTTGRRSGTVRTTGLVYARDGHRLVVAASDAGADRHPAWFHNLRVDPRVELQIGRRSLWAVAGIVPTADPDHRRLWPLVNAASHERYDHYQALTSRPIPLVVLEPMTNDVA